MDTRPDAQLDPPSAEMLDEPWQLSTSVALRPERFGALAYHFGNRRLTFLKHPTLVTLVKALGEHPDLRSALNAVGVEGAQHAGYAKALQELARADVIRPRASAVA